MALLTEECSWQYYRRTFAAAAASFSSNAAFAFAALVIDARNWVVVTELLIVGRGL